MSKVTKLPISKDHENIDYVSVIIFPSFVKGNIEMKMEVKTNKDTYHRNEVLPADIMKSQFDHIFDRVREEIKRFMLNDSQTH